MAEKPVKETVGAKRNEALWLRALLRLIESYLSTCRPIMDFHPDSAEIISRRQTAIAALWHSSLIYTLYHFRNNPATVMVSASSDGEWVARALRIWGQFPVRGSRLKGGLAAIREMERLITERHISAGIVADGANGPALRAQKGAVILARDTGLPIIPTGFAARPAYHFHSWDRMTLPLPCSRVAMVYGPPITVPAGSRGGELERYRLLLEKSLNQATSRAGSIVKGRRPV